MNILGHKRVFDENKLVTIKQWLTVNYKNVRDVDSEVLLRGTNYKEIKNNQLLNVLRGITSEEFKAISEHYRYLSILYARLDSLTMVKLLEWIVESLNKLKNKKTKYNNKTKGSSKEPFCEEPTAQEVVNIVNDIPEKISITLPDDLKSVLLDAHGKNKDQIYSSTESCKNIILSAINATSLLGQTSYAYFNELLSLMMLIKERLSSNPTFLPAPFFLGNIPVGVSVYAHISTVDEEIRVEDTFYTEFYHNQLDALYDVWTVYEATLQGVRNFDIEAPAAVLKKVFETRFFQELLSNLKIENDQVVVENPSSGIYKEISNSGPLYSDITTVRIWMWQILFNAATVEGLLEDPWTFDLIEEQLVARPIDNLPNKVSITREKIKRASTLQEVIDIYESILYDDAQFNRHGDTLTQHFHVTIKNKIQLLMGNNVLTDEDSELLNRCESLGLIVGTWNRTNSLLEQQEIIEEPSYVVIKSSSGYHTKIDINKLVDFADLALMISEEYKQTLNRLLVLPNGFSELLRAVYSGNEHKLANPRVKCTASGTYYYQFALNGQTINVGVTKANGEIIIVSNFNLNEDLKITDADGERSTENTAENDVGINEKPLDEKFIDIINYTLDFGLDKAVFQILKNITEKIQSDSILKKEITSTLAELIRRGVITWLCLESEYRDVDYEKVARDLLDYTHRAIWGIASYDRFTTEAQKYFVRLQKTTGYIQDLKSSFKTHYNGDRRSQIMMLKDESGNIMIGMYITSNYHP